jgi:hypothetical protein
LKDEISNTNKNRKRKLILFICLCLCLCLSTQRERERERESWSIQSINIYKSCPVFFESCFLLLWAILLPEKVSRTFLLFFFFFFLFSNSSLVCLHYIYIYIYKKKNGTTERSVVFHGCIDFFLKRN